jgi:hypothetical protein
MQVLSGFFFERYSHDVAIELAAPGCVANDRAKAGDEQDA